MSKLFYKFINTLDETWYINLIDIVSIRDLKATNEIIISLSDGTKVMSKDKEILNLIEIYEAENE